MFFSVPLLSLTASSIITWVPLKARKTNLFWRKLCVLWLWMMSACKTFYWWLKYSISRSTWSVCWMVCLLMMSGVLCIRNNWLLLCLGQSAIQSLLQAVFRCCLDTTLGPNETVFPGIYSLFFLAFDLSLHLALSFSVRPYWFLCLPGRIQSRSIWLRSIDVIPVLVKVTFAILHICLLHVE